MKSNLEQIRLHSNSKKIIFFVSLFTLLHNIFISFYGGWSTGISTDEPTHVTRLDSYFKSGWYLNPSGQNLGSGYEYVYGPVASLFGQLISSLLRNTNFFAIDNSFTGYQFRHLAIGLVGVITLFIIYIVVRKICDSRIWGIFSAAMISAIPLWTGHSMFNMKDFPVASGYTLATLGLIYIGLNEGHYKYRIIGASIVTAGLVLAVGTRPGIWPLLFFNSLLAPIIKFLLQKKARQSSRGVSYKYTKELKFIVIPWILSYVALLLIYPNAFSKPFDLLKKSVLGSANFAAWNGTVLISGEFYLQPVPRWYIPVWIMNQIPILILLFFMLGLIFYCYYALIIFSKPQPNESVEGKLFAFSLILSQATVGPFAAIVMNSRLYGGIRQILFIVPAIGLLAVFGIWFLNHWVKNNFNQKKSLHYIGIFIAIAILGIPTLEQRKIFPYNYTYYNEIATLNEIDGNWPVDGWRTSLKELYTKIGNEGIQLCTPERPTGNPLAVEYITGPPFLGAISCQQRYPITWQTSEPIVESLPKLTETQFWYIELNQFGTRLPKNCEKQTSVNRNLRGRELTMSFIARCEAHFFLLPKTGQIEFSPDNQKYLLDGWDVIDNEIWSTNELARIGVQLPDSYSNSNLKITIYGQRLNPPGENRPLYIMVNNVPLKYKINNKTEIEVFVPNYVADKFKQNRALISINAISLVKPSDLVIGAGEIAVGFKIQSINFELTE